MTSFVRELAAFRLRSAAEVQAEVDAMLARVDGDFDAVDAYAGLQLGRFREAGVLPDRRKKPRAEASR